jgi:UTP-glucose-1-phosphate uridylyltransferase
MGINTETIFDILEASKQGGGGGGQSHAALNAAAKDSGQSTYVGPDGQTYDVQ